MSFKSLDLQKGTFKKSEVKADWGIRTLRLAYTRGRNFNERPARLQLLNDFIFVGKSVVLFRLNLIWNDLRRFVDEEFVELATLPHA